MNLRGLFCLTLQNERLYYRSPILRVLNWVGAKRPLWFSVFIIIPPLYFFLSRTKGPFMVKEQGEVKHYSCLLSRFPSLSIFLPKVPQTVFSLPGSSINHQSKGSFLIYLREPWDLLFDGWC